jgi:hypothetical protein
VLTIGADGPDTVVPGLLAAGECASASVHGRTVQVDPMRPPLKAPKTKRLKL